LTVGTCEGLFVGQVEGSLLLGSRLGVELGSPEGSMVGMVDGIPVGGTTGADEGSGIPQNSLNTS